MDKKDRKKYTKIKKTQTYKIWKINKKNILRPKLEKRQLTKTKIKNINLAEKN